MMFDINGGLANVFTMAFIMISLGMFVGMPVLTMWAQDKSKFPMMLAGLFGFALWFILLWIGNPSLTFWKA